jgi:hypothetical protein
VRTRNQLEPLGERGPLLLVSVKPTFVAHVRPAPPTKCPDGIAVRACGEERGPINIMEPKKRGHPSGIGVITGTKVCRIRVANPPPRIR